MISLDLSLASNADALAALEQYPERYARELTAAMLEAGLLLERQIKELAPVGVGGAAGYRGSIAAIPPYMNGDILTGGVGTSAPYAVPVELGTRPHFPPVQPIADWVRAKLGEKDPDAARSIAYCIARKIAAHGTEGQHIFKRALDAAQEQLAGIFDRAVERTVNAGAARAGGEA